MTAEIIFYTNRICEKKKLFSVVSNPTYLQELK